MEEEGETRECQMHCISNEAIRYITGDDGHLGSGSLGGVIVRAGFYGEVPVAAKCSFFGGGRRQNYALDNELKGELSNLQRTKHENIIKVFGWTRWYHSAAIIMEYMPGGDLWSLLQDKNVPISRLLDLQLCDDIAKGLSYIHEERLVHSDIKPENVLLTVNLKCKIADFGSAHLSVYTRYSASADKTKPNIRFTEVYAAPELLKCPSKIPHHSQDTFSFAIVVYTIIVRDRPIDQPYLKELYLDQIQRGEYPFLKRVEDMLRQADEESNDFRILTLLEKIIKNCSSFMPDERPFMKDVNQELCQFKGGFDTTDITKALEVAKEKHFFLNFKREDHDLQPIKDYRIEDGVARSSDHNPSVKLKDTLAFTSSTEHDGHETAHSSSAQHPAAPRNLEKHPTPNANANRFNAGTSPSMQFIPEKQNLPKNATFSQAPVQPLNQTITLQITQQPTQNLTSSEQPQVVPLSNCTSVGATFGFTLQQPSNASTNSQPTSASNVYRTNAAASQQQFQPVPTPCFTINVQVIPNQAWMVPNLSIAPNFQQQSTPGTNQSLYTQPVRPTADASTSSSLPTADTSTSSSLPTLDTPTSRSLPTADTPTSSSLPTADTSTSSSLPTADTSTSSSLPTADTPTSSSLPTADTPTSSSLPTADTSTSSSLPTADTPTSSSLPTADTSTSSSLPTADTSTSRSLPTADTPTSSSLPTADTPTSSSLPTADTSTSSSLPTSDNIHQHVSWSSIGCDDSPQIPNTTVASSQPAAVTSNITESTDVSTNSTSSAS